MGGTPPKRCVCFRETPGSERQKEGSRAPRGPSLHPGTHGVLSARATCRRERQLPALGILSSPRAARGPHRGSPGLPSCLQVRVRELGPVMIKPAANGASRRAHTLWWLSRHLNLGTWLAGTCG